MYYLVFSALAKWITWPKKEAAWAVLGEVQEYTHLFVKILFNSKVCDVCIGKLRHL